MDTVMAEQRRALMRNLFQGALLRSEAGSTTLEFAVAIPVVVLLVIGSMVTMIGLLAYGNAEYATDLAARYAALHGSTSDLPATSQSITAEVQSHLWLGGQSAEVTTSWASDNLPGSAVTVSTVLTVPLAIPFTSVNQLTIAASANRVITR